jgi:hypothetical protein
VRWFYIRYKFVAHSSDGRVKCRWFQTSRLRDQLQQFEYGVRSRVESFTTFSWKVWGEEEKLGYLASEFELEILPNTTRC